MAIILANIYVTGYNFNNKKFTKKYVKFKKLNHNILLNKINTKI